MKRLGTFTALLAIALPASAVAAADVVLSPEAATGLQAARSPADIAVLVQRHPAQAATLMSDAAALGIASPAAILGRLVFARTDCAKLHPLVLAAAQAAPPEADISAAVALSAIGEPRAECVLATIAGGAVDELEAAGLSAELLDAEIAEIATSLGELVPGSLPEIAVAIAAATDTDLDTAAMVLASIGETIETADIPPAATPARARVPIIFRDMPSEAQNNPSAN